MPLNVNSNENKSSAVRCFVHFSHLFTQHSRADVENRLRPQVYVRECVLNAAKKEIVSITFGRNFELWSSFVRPLLVFILGYR